MRLLGLIVLLVGCAKDSGKDPDLGPPASKSRAAASPAAELNPRLLRRFKPLRTNASTSEAQRSQIELGKMLFFDARLSRNRDVSCSSCHGLDAGGADGKPTSIGSRGVHGKRNAPTVYNAAWHLAQFWDGRTTKLEDQASGPLLDPSEMAMLSPSAVTAVLRSIPGYAEPFAKAFPGEAPSVDFDHARRALAEFERTLLTPARWDRFLAGDTHALTATEIEGLKVFADVGCVQCHTGELVGASMFQRVGVNQPWPNQTDQGRFAITHNEADRMTFKVPSLRNVTLTAPYFHDGSAKTLDRAVRMMAHHQLGFDLDAHEVAAIVAWLGSLTGQPPRSMTERPALPPDGPTTTALAR